MDPRLEDLLLEWESRADRGQPVDPAELCAAAPELALELARQVRLLTACRRAFDAVGETADLPAAAPDRPPSRVAGYEIRRAVGAGGMGVVYEGWDPVLGRPVAVKMIRPRPAPGWLDPEGLAGRFDREARVLARLKHPNIVPVYAAGVAHGEPYFVMEYVPGGTLADHRARLTAAGPAVVGPLMAKVADAVHHAHSQGVLHRDLKPGNVLLTAADEPLVADFGLATLVDPGSPAATTPGRTDTPPNGDGPTTTVTAPGGRPGTPAYMAPEQFDPNVGPVGPATDVWALGVMLFELLTGRRPFPGGTRSACAAWVMTVPTPPLVAVRRGRRYEAIVRRCLAKRPQDRYSTAADVARALRAAGTTRGRRLVLWAGAGVVAAGVGAWQVFTPSPPLPPPPADADTTDPRTRAALARLEGGQDAVLIPAPGGQPAVPVVLRSGTAVPHPDGTVTLTTPDVCLAELLPRLPPGEWVVEAELQHVEGGRLSEVGVFTAAAHNQGLDGRRAVVFMTTYSEHGLAIAHRGERGKTHTRFAYFDDSPRSNQPRWQRQWDGPTFTPAAGDAPRPVRTIQVALTWRGPVATWNHNQEFVWRTWVEFEKWLAESPPWVSDGFRVTPAGGVGVYVRDGTVRVTRFVVRKQQRQP